MTVVSNYDAMEKIPEVL